MAMVSLDLNLDQPRDSWLRQRLFRDAIIERMSLLVIFNVTWYLNLKLPTDSSAFHTDVTDWRKRPNQEIIVKE